MLTRRAVVLIKKETTYGVDPTPVAGTDAVAVMDPSIKVAGDKLERNILRSNFSPSALVIGKKVVELKFKAELKGAGAAYSASVKPEIAAALRACGFSETIVTTPGSETITYQPVSSGFESCTIYLYNDGLVHKITGCFGTVKISLPAGKYAEAEFSFKGLFAAPTDAAIVSPTLSTVLPPIVQSLGLAIGAFTTGIFGALEIDAGVDVSERPDVNSAQGLKGLAITGRKPSGSVDPLAVTEATHPFWADWAAGTQKAITALLGSVQYNKVQFDMPKAQQESVDYGDRGGERTYQMPLQFNGNAGDDELVITFK